MLDKVVQLAYLSNYLHIYQYEKLQIVLFLRQSGCTLSEYWAIYCLLSNIHINIPANLQSIFFIYNVSLSISHFLQCQNIIFFDKENLLFLSIFWEELFIYLKRFTILHDFTISVNHHFLNLNDWKLRRLLENIPHVLFNPNFNYSKPEQAMTH